MSRFSACPVCRSPYVGARALAAVTTAIVSNAYSEDVEQYLREKFVNYC